MLIDEDADKFAMITGSDPTDDQPAILADNDVTNGTGEPITASVASIEAGEDQTVAIGAMFDVQASAIDPDLPHCERPRPRRVHRGLQHGAPWARSDPPRPASASQTSRGDGYSTSVVFTYNAMTGQYTNSALRKPVQPADHDRDQPGGPGGLLPVRDQRLRPGHDLRGQPIHPLPEPDLLHELRLGLRGHPAHRLGRAGAGDARLHRRRRADLRGRHLEPRRMLGPGHGDRRQGGLGAAADLGVVRHPGPGQRRVGRRLRRHPIRQRELDGSAEARRGVLLRERRREQRPRHHGGLGLRRQRPGHRQRPVRRREREYRQ